MATSTTSEPLTNWLELPSDIMINIFRRVGVVDILENVEKVCSTWHNICKEPTFWRVIHMNCTRYLNEKSQICLEEICKLAVDRSQGQLVDFTAVGFNNDEILRYVADRSSQLRRLEITYCLFESWNEAFKKFPLLEELNLYSTLQISKEAIETAGRYCPMLKTLRVKRRPCRFCAGKDVERSKMVDNEFAKAIGENLVGLRHLELIGCSMSNLGLQGILNGCYHLKSLDLSDCWNLYLNKDLVERCSEQIKHLKLPSIYKFSGAYADHTTKPWQVLDECDDFEDYDDFSLEEAVAASMNNLRFGRASGTVPRKFYLW